MDADFTSRVMRACQLLKAHDLEDVAAFLANAELSKRKQKRKPRVKRKASLADPLTGKPIRGGVFELAMTDGE